MNCRALLLFACVLLISADSHGGPARPSSIRYAHPPPGAELVSRETNVIVRFDGAARDYVTDPVTMFSAVGSQSGRHFGESLVSDDGETILFQPDVPFEPGERVSVTIRYRDPNRGGAIEAFEFGFTVSPRRARPLPPDPRSFLKAHGIVPPHGAGDAPDRVLPAGASPPPDFPPLDISIVDDPGEGYVFLTNYLWEFPAPPSYVMILRNDGTPVFFRRANGFAVDFKKQNDERLSFFEYTPYAWIVLDSTYARVDVCRCGNGYVTDTHDFWLLDNGHYLLICQDVQEIDMSTVVPGGRPDANVVGIVFQELDRSKNVVFEWRSWDHFEITDAIQIDFTGPRVDYVHANTLVLDHDGNWLISSRHLSEVTKVDRATGDIIWRLGGRNNQFRFAGDIDDSTGFHYQHDIRRLDNGNYMLYDNGNFHSPPYSRAVEYALDTGDMTATRVWQYRDTPDTYGDYMGSAQRLPGGNTVIAWGGNHSGPITTITEVHPDGSKAFELTILNGTLTYKGYRFPWSGTAPEPFLWVCDFDKFARRLTLNFDKFGDRNVAMYELYAGEDSAPLILADTSYTNTVGVADIRNDVTYHFRVRSVDAVTAQRVYSNEVTFRYENQGPSRVNLVGPGDGAVVETAEVELSWTRATDAEGDDVTYAVHIFEDGGGTTIDGITDTFYVYGGSVAAPHAGFAWTVSARDHQFSAASTDTFRVRSSRAGFGVPVAPALHQNYPNPFNPGTTIRYDLTAGGRVTLTVYNVLGQEVRTLVDQLRPAGFWSSDWDGRDNRGTDVASGVYLYRLEAPGFTGSHKMILIR